VALGIGPAAIDKRLSRGSLIEIHRGVYAVGHLAPAPFQREHAALLAIGDGAVLSHLTAAEVWGLGMGDGNGVHAIAPPRTGRRSRHGLVVHRPRTVPRDEVTGRHGLPLTTVARTLVDLASVVDRRALERAIDKAEHLGLLDHGELERTLDRAPGRRGTRTLRRILATLEGPNRTRSELEERFLALCRDAGLPLPRMNQRLGLSAGSAEVDCLWPTQRLVVELDGFASHSTRIAFGRDRWRDRQLRRAGFEPLRYTWNDIVRYRDATVDELRDFLSHGPP
jgi:very-short-patch-repair endonuclease